METALTAIKALADGNRLRVVAALMKHDELCVCQIVELLRLATATVSQHMRILQNAQLVQSRKQGRWVYYRLTQGFPDLLRLWLVETLANSPEVKRDAIELAAVLACDPETLCRRQKMRKATEDCSS
jgi:ArsR family transcriptional regulator, arsenate/arsenite/antimonite-responsive transcriptional repressor